MCKVHGACYIFAQKTRQPLVLKETTNPILTMQYLSFIDIFGVSGRTIVSLRSESS